MVADFHFVLGLGKSTREVNLKALIGKTRRRKVEILAFLAVAFAKFKQPLSIGVRQADLHLSGLCG